MRQITLTDQDIEGIKSLCHLALLHKKAGGMNIMPTVAMLMSKLSAPPLEFPQPQRPKMVHSEKESEDGKPAAV